MMASTVSSGRRSDADREANCEMLAGGKIGLQIMRVQSYSAEASSTRVKFPEMSRGIKHNGRPGTRGAAASDQRFIQASTARLLSVDERERGYRANFAKFSAIF